MTMDKTEIKPGQSFEVITGLPLKVMAVTEGYVMARHKGCFPFVETVEAFKARVSKYKPRSSAANPTHANQ